MLFEDIKNMRELLREQEWRGKDRKKTQEPYEPQPPTYTPHKKNGKDYPQSCGP